MYKLIWLNSSFISMIKITQKTASFRFIIKLRDFKIIAMGNFRFSDLARSLKIHVLFRSDSNNSMYYQLILLTEVKIFGLLQ